MQPEFRRSVRAKKNPADGRRVKKRVRWKRWVFGLPTAMLLPFLLLVRVSTWLYITKAMNGWGAIAVSGILAAILLGSLIMVIGRRSGIKLKVKTLQVSAILVGIYCIYLLVYISASHVKSPDLSDTYIQLHPVLRVALSSLTMIDQELLVTDIARVRSDYRQMGLPERSTSFHYAQDDGFVHAVDLRTKNRSEIQNSLTRKYFNAMGFSTLRHVGTADHLHVSLPVVEK